MSETVQYISLPHCVGYVRLDRASEEDRRLAESFNVRPFTVSALLARRYEAAMNLLHSIEGELLRERLSQEVKAPPSTVTSPVCALCDMDILEGEETVTTARGLEHRYHTVEAPDERNDAE